MSAPHAGVYAAREQRCAGSNPLPNKILDTRNEREAFTRQRTYNEAANQLQIATNL